MSSSRIGRDLVRRQAAQLHAPRQLGQIQLETTRKDVNPESRDKRVLCRVVHIIFVELGQTSVAELLSTALHNKPRGGEWFRTRATEEVIQRVNSAAYALAGFRALVKRVGAECQAIDGLRALALVAAGRKNSETVQKIAERNRRNHSNQEWWCRISASKQFASPCTSAVARALRTAGLN